MIFMENSDGTKAQATAEHMFGFVSYLAESVVQYRGEFWGRMVHFLQNLDARENSELYTAEKGGLFVQRRKNTTGKNSHRSDKKKPQAKQPKRDPKVFERAFEECVGRRPAEYLLDKMQTESRLSDIQYLFAIIEAQITTKYNCTSYGFDHYYRNAQKLQNHADTCANGEGNCLDPDIAKKEGEQPMRQFYGEEYSTMKRLKSGDPQLETLGDLYAVLRKCWCKETAYPSCQKEWVPEDPSYGQCAITAMLVHDMFGGTIHRIRVSGGGTHYFNKLDGHYIDLTREQFDLYHIPVNYEPNEEMDRKNCGKNIDTGKRYKLLIQNIQNYLGATEH